MSNGERPGTAGPEGQRCDPLLSNSTSANSGGLAPVQDSVDPPSQGPSLTLLYSLLALALAAAIAIAAMIVLPFYRQR
ncbi:MAG: hypothetical protein WB341_08040 [Terracidiphilus sp.]